jgi:hypothetical protein
MSAPSCSTNQYLFHAPGELSLISQPFFTSTPPAPTTAADAAEVTEVAEAADVNEVDEVDDDDVGVVLTEDVLESRPLPPSGIPRSPAPGASGCLWAPSGAEVVKRAEVEGDETVAAAAAAVEETTSLMTLLLLLLPMLSLKLFLRIGM